LLLLLKIWIMLVLCYEQFVWFVGIFLKHLVVFWG